MVIVDKFVGGPGHAVFISFASDASVGIGDGDKEVWGGLAIGGLISHVDEVFASKRSRTVVDHPTFVDDTDLVEEVIYVLGGLVDGGDCRYFGDIGGDPKGLNEFECCGGIKTSSRAAKTSQRHEG